MLQFGLATGSDDADVRRLLRDGTLPGRIALSFEREPDAALAAAIEGDVREILVARDTRSGALAGVASRAVRRMFINGSETDVGYLGQLRIGGSRHLRSLIDDGFRLLRSRDPDRRVPGYLVSLVDGNDAARRLLIDRTSSAMPRFVSAGRLTTFALPARRVRRNSDPASRFVRPATVDDADAIAACLRRNLARYQFAPVWTAGLLESAERTRGLAFTDFAVVERQGRIVGCAALWDQRAFKQVVVRGYQPSLQRARWLVNGAAPWLGAPRLPPVGQALAFGFISHLVVDDDDADDLRELLTVLRDRARQSSLDHVVVGAPADHPTSAAIAASGKYQAYGSELFLAYWPDGDAFARSLDGRPPNPEVAVL